VNVPNRVSGTHRYFLAQPVDGLTDPAADDDPAKAQVSDATEFSAPTRRSATRPSFRHPHARNAASSVSRSSAGRGLWINEVDQCRRSDLVPASRTRTYRRLPPEDDLMERNSGHHSLACAANPAAPQQPARLQS